jgi:uncharacterized membrane protein YgcG
MTMARRLLLTIALAALIFLTSGRAEAQQGWSIQSFDVHVSVAQDSTLSVSEEIVVDFGALPTHGIFRTIPVEYKYDGDHNRATSLHNVTVDDGRQTVRFTSSRKGANLVLKIGDPDIEVTGVQRYRIAYTVEGALNPHEGFDELYWNATGDKWEVDIDSASASVQLPGDDIEQAQCFQGATGSTTACDSSTSRGNVASFSARNLGPREGLTIDVAIRKGALDVPSLRLVDAPRDAVETAIDIFRPKPLPGAIAAGLVVLALAGIARAWWLIGRDRWYGDSYYVNETPPADAGPKPLFAHQTIVVQYTPPEIGEAKRRLRPAEIGVLIDEKADTLDVSATIVDLAVRKYLVIKELPDEGIFGMFKSQDYELERLPKEDDLLPYERTLLTSLFDGKPTVKLSDLKTKFHDDLQEVKSSLYTQAVSENKFFTQDPEKVRRMYVAFGAGLVVAGIVAAWLLELSLHAGVIGLPVAIGGVVLLLIARAMPRRTPFGWETYRLALGFRVYMVTAETDRQKFAEDENIFHEYLPFAIVYGCVKKWAETFEQLGIKPEAGYYIGTRPFAPVLFAESVRGFSTSISGAMASTPGGSGGSGFSIGGGFSGGGLGGGGGGRW